MNAQHRVVLLGADEEARRHDDVVVLRLRIDMLDPVDALDDVFQRPRHEFDGVLGLIAVRRHENVDHRNGNLRLLLARQRLQGDQANEQGGQQQQRRQRRRDEGARESAGNAKLHGVTTTLPSTRPERISTPSARCSPVCTTISAPDFRRMKSTPARRYTASRGARIVSRRPVVI